MSDSVTTIGGGTAPPLDRFAVLPPTMGGPSESGS